MLTYEDVADEIDLILAKKSGKWRLVYPSFEDVSQLVRVHIFTKFDMWDQSRPFAKWASQVAERRIINIYRDHYKKMAPPCTSCKLCAGGNQCKFTSSGIKDSECPLYRKWEKKKKDGFAIQSAGSIEQMTESGFPPGNESVENLDLQQSIDAFHEKMKSALSEKMFKIYKMFYIEGRGDEYVSKELGLKNNERNGNSKRVPGYKMLHNYRETLLEKAKEVMRDFDMIKV